MSEKLTEMLGGMEKVFWCYAGDMYGAPMEPAALRAYLRRMGVLLNFCPSCHSLDIVCSNGVFKCTQCKKAFRVTEVTE